MGGKAKQRQRTKNNVRPSSSARSAELLSNPVKLESTLVNVGGGKVLPSLFPTMVNLTIDHSISPEFSLCMKKLNKKDPITKTKALQELSELVKKSEVDDVAAALPTWAHFYRVLGTDTDRKVRELTQVCHGSFSGALGRRLAPHLKRLLPAWLAALHDDHKPAAAAARDSLASTFPEGKLPDVISFCKEEVMTYLMENLFNNLETATGKTSVDGEEAEEQARRVAASSLQALQVVVRVLCRAAHQRAWLWPHLQRLHDDPRYWRLPHTCCPHLRAAWCGAEGAAAAAGGAEWGAAWGARVLRQLLRGAGSGGAEIWAALGDIATHVPEWHTLLDDRTLIIKRILEVLKSGGWGDARRLMELVPPLTDRPPGDPLADTLRRDLLDAAIDGAETRSVTRSRSEWNAWLAGLADLVERAEPPEVASDAQRRWARRALVAPPALVTPLAERLAALLAGWRRRDPDLARLYWLNLGAAIEAHVADPPPHPHPPLADLFAGHVRLLRALRAALLEPRRRRAVAFAGDERPPSPPPADDGDRERTEREMRATLEAACATYLEAGRGAAAPAVLELVRLSGGGELLRGAARRLGLRSPLELCGPLLAEVRAADGGAPAELAFELLECAPDEERAATFASLEQLPDVAVERCVSLCVTPPHCAMPAARRWVRGPAAEAALLRVTRRALHSDDGEGEGEARRLLRLCVAGPEPPVGERAASAALKEVAAAICGGEGGTRRAVALAAELDEPPPSAAYLDLLLRLFRLTLLGPMAEGEAEGAGEVWRAAGGALRGGLRGVPAEGAALLVRRAALLAHTHLDDHGDAVEESRAELAAAACAALVPPEPPAAAAALRLLAAGGEGRGEGDGDEDRRRVAAVALHRCRLTLRLAAPCDDVEPELDRGTLLRHAHRALFRALLLRTVLLRAAAEEGEGDAADADALLAQPDVASVLAAVLRDCAAFDALRDGFEFCDDCDAIDAVSGKLDAAVEELAAATSPATGDRVSAHLATLTGGDDGFLFSLAKFYYESKIRPEREGDPEREIDVSQFERGASDATFFHNLQAELRYFPGSAARLTARHLVMLHAVCCAHPALLPAVSWSAPAADLDVLLDLHYRHGGGRIMLYDRDISDAGWAEVVSNAAAVELLREQVAARGWELPAAHWDFVTITLCELLASLERARRHWRSPKVAMLALSVARLVTETAEFVGGVSRECERRQPTDHVAGLPREWGDVFLPDVTRRMLALLHAVLDDPDSRPLSCSGRVTVSALQRCAGLVRAVAGEGAGEGGAERLSALCARGLQRVACPPRQLVAYRVLRAVELDLHRDDCERLQNSSETSRPQYSLSRLLPALRQLQDLALDLLRDYREGEPETLQPSPRDAGFGAARGCLQLTVALAELAARAQGDLAHHYIQLLGEFQFAERTVSVALRLLPAPLARWAGEGVERAPPAGYGEWFLGDGDGARVERLACRALALGAGGVAGGGARGWAAAACPPRAARSLRRLVRHYVTPPLVRRHLADALAGVRALADTQIVAHWSSNEARCIFNVDERPLELVVRFADDHPLSLPRVELSRPLPDVSTHWVALYLAYQNGTLVRALQMWRDSITARLENVRQCYVCYCRLHHATGRLPNTQCHQCTNKFHKECLRKWFTTSKSYRCPLCRATF